MSHNTCTRSILYEPGERNRDKSSLQYWQHTHTPHTVGFSKTKNREADTTMPKTRQQKDATNAPGIDAKHGKDCAPQAYYILSQVSLEKKNRLKRKRQRPNKIVTKYSDAWAGDGRKAGNQHRSNEAHRVTGRRQHIYIYISSGNIIPIILDLYQYHTATRWSYFKNDDTYITPLPLPTTTQMHIRTPTPTPKGATDLL